MLRVTFILALIGIAAMLNSPAEAARRHCTHTRLVPGHMTKKGYVPRHYVCVREPR